MIKLIPPSNSLLDACCYAYLLPYISEKLNGYVLERKKFIRSLREQLSIEFQMEDLNELQKYNLGEQVNLERAKEYLRNEEVELETFFLPYIAKKIKHNILFLYQGQKEGKKGRDERDERDGRKELYRCPSSIEEKMIYIQFDGVNYYTMSKQKNTAVFQTVFDVNDFIWSLMQE